jgi:mannobiose 2-epimerase
MENPMKIFRLLAYSGIVCLLFFTSCKKNTEKLYLGVPVSQIDSQLTNLLGNFYPRIIDTVHGGYWTNFENDWTLSEDQDKMLVTQARGLWTAAKAAQMFPDNPVYRKAADHGYKFLTTQMWDSIKGGFYENCFSDSAQKTDASFKLTYGNSFALYALSEYAQINKDQTVLNWVRKSFNWLETEMHDPELKGYYNIWIQSDNYRAEAIKKAGWGNADWKDQNTSIHLMEALTAAYRVLPEQAVKDRLTEMLELVRDTMTTSEGYLRLFFTKTWQPISLSDSSKDYIIKKPYFDHISFGHNIETAYLLVDASEALYGSIDSVTLKVATKLIDHTIKYGFDKDFYGLFDKGYRFKPSENIEVIDSAKVWWAQAEAWHALALFSEIYPDNTVYPDAFKKMWGYINDNVIDHEYGGWYNSGTDSDPQTIRQRKAHAWKSCYHDGRAMMMVMKYASEK